jgi:hypothetical protein
MRKTSIIERLIAVVVAALGVQQGYQGVTELRFDPWLLTLEYAVVCVTGLIAGYGVWRGRRWGPAALAVNGLTTAVLVVSLEPILNLPAEARRGLWIGAGGIALFTAAAVWYTRRAERIGQNH